MTQVIDISSLWHINPPQFKPWLLIILPLHYPCGSTRIIEIIMFSTESKYYYLPPFDVKVWYKMLRLICFLQVIPSR